jgi:hypothetical protein
MGMIELFICLIVVGVPFLAWCAYLGFCAWLVRYVGKSEALRDAAVAALAFPFRPGGLRMRSTKSSSRLPREARSETDASPPSREDC